MEEITFAEIKQYSDNADYLIAVLADLLNEKETLDDLRFEILDWARVCEKIRR